MFSNKLAFAALGAACILAASAGGYLALRQNATSTATSAATDSTEPAPSRPSTDSAGSPVQAEAPTSVPAPRTAPVQETEAVVSRASPAATPAAARIPAKPTTATGPSTFKRVTTPVPVQASRTDTPASFDRSSPTSATSSGSAPASPAPAPPPSPEPVAPPLRPGDTVVVAQDPAPPPEAPQKSPQKSYDELVVSADSVIGLQSETSVSSERARVEDRVEARVTRDVRVGNRVAIPAGSRAIGSVSQVERGGKFKEHARLAIRFQTVVLSDGTRLPISTDAVIREGSAPSHESAKKIGGGAVAGTILGAILGGAKGAAIGGMAGAGAGVVAAGDRNAATLNAGEPITIRLLSPVTVTPER